MVPRIPEYEKVTTGTFSSEYEEDSDEWNKEHEEWLQKQPKDLDFLGWFDEDGNSVDFDWKIPNHDITVTGKFKDPDTKVLCKVNYYIPSASGYVLHSTDYEYKYPGEVYSPAVKILGDLVSPDVQSVTVVSGKECQVDYYYSKQEVTSEVYAFYQKVDGSYDTDISTATKIDTLSGSKGEEKAFSLAETGTFEGVTKTLVVTGEPIYVQIPRKTQEITFTCDKGIKSLQVDFQDVEKGFKKSFYIGQSVVLSATAKDGYMLKSWSTGGVSQEVTVVVTQDTTSVSVNSEHIAFPIHYQNFDENYNELTEGIVNNNPTNYFIDSDDIHLQQPKLYCFYFATILHTAFSRGEVCWHRCHGHIVWRDTDGQTYDIGGLFLDADPEDILPVDSSLGSMVVDFLHNGDEFKSTDPDFNEWAKLQDSTPVVALSTIYRIIPADERNDSESVEKNVLVYWRKHRSDRVYLQWDETE